MPPWTIEWLEWPSLPIKEALAREGWAVGTVYLEGGSRAGDREQWEASIQKQTLKTELWSP